MAEGPTLGQLLGKTAGRLFQADAFSLFLSMVRKSKGFKDKDFCPQDTRRESAPFLEEGVVGNSTR